MAKLSNNAIEKDEKEVFMAKALEGMKILDCTQWEAGTSCTEQLAFLGADVVKIEPPGRGETGRTVNLTKEDLANGIDSWYFISLNANKRSVTLNLKTKKGVELFKTMAKKADIVVSNFVPGTMDELGIGYSVLSRINPKLVYAENSGFGKGGPYQDYASMDPIAKATGGSYSVVGMVNGPPLNPGPTIGDTGSGMHMAIGILAAYIYAQRTGEGQFVDQSMADAVINLMRVRMSATTYGLRKPALRQTEPDVLKCKGDGPNDYAYAVISTDKHFAEAMKLIGRNDLLNSDMKNDRILRQARMAEIRNALEAWTRTRTKMEVFHTLAKLGIPAAPVLDTVEVIDDPHFNQRGMIVEFNHAKRGKFKMPGCPIRLSKNDYEYRAAPLLGQDTESVLKEWLSLSQDEIAGLKSEKVI